MPNNYYEIKMLRLKVLYLLAGWAVIIFAGQLSLYFSNTLLENLCAHSHLTPDTKNTILAVIFIVIFIFTLSFSVDMLVFSNWICFRFWETWGLSIVFMIITFLCFATVDLGIASDWFYYGSFLMLDWMMLSLYQVLIFLPVFTIAYFIWVFNLQKWKGYTPLSKRTRTFLYLLNLPLIFTMILGIIYVFSGV